jgi:hypothetical protein
VVQKAWHWRAEEAFARKSQYDVFKSLSCLQRANTFLRIHTLVAGLCCRCGGGLPLDILDHGFGAEADRPREKDHRRLAAHCRCSIRAKA